MSKREKLLTLFGSMLYISALTFGGGFVIVTFMKKKFVDKLKWIDEQEMLDITALAQVSPGAIAVNTAIMIGWRIAGFVGMLIAILGTIIPPMAILSVISFFYKAFASNVYVAVTLSGMHGGIAAVILDVVFNLGTNVVKERSILSICLMIGAFIVTFVFHVNVVIIIFAVIIIGVLSELCKYKKRCKSDMF